MSCSTAAANGSDTASAVEISALLQRPVAPQTSLMIHNIPVQYTKEMLLAEWRNNGTYDLFYLPWNPEAQRNLSYAFLNCTSEAARVH